MQITDEQINKRIAEFMGGLWCHSCETIWETSYFVTARTYCDNCRYGDQKLFTESLDALIPVVEKLVKERGGVYRLLGAENLKNELLWTANCTDLNNDRLEVLDKSPAKALALAIYEVLENE